VDFGNGATAGAPNEALRGNREAAFILLSRLRFVNQLDRTRALLNEAGKEQAE